MSRYLSLINYLPATQQLPNHDEPITFTNPMDHIVADESRINDLFVERGINRDFTEEQKELIDEVKASNVDARAIVRLFIQQYVGDSEEIVVPDPQLGALVRLFTGFYNMYRNVNETLMTPAHLMVNRELMVERFRAIQKREMELWVACEHAENVVQYLAHFERKSPDTYVHFMGEALYMEQALRGYFAYIYFFLLDKPRNDAILFKNIRKITKQWERTINAPVSMAVSRMGLHMPVEIIRLLSEF